MIKDWIRLFYLYIQILLKWNSVTRLSQDHASIKE
jgi:hypothetical protein